MAAVRRHLLLPLLFLSSCLMTLAPAVMSDLVISRVDRRIDLKSQIVRSFMTLKVENDGANSVSEVLLSFPEHQAKNLAHLNAFVVKEKGKSKTYSNALPVNAANPEGVPASLTWYAVSLPKELGNGARVTLEIRAVLTHAQRPFPAKNTQADPQLILFQESAYFISPYAVKAQSLTFKLPEPTRVESYTKIESTKLSGLELKYGPYENLPAFSYRPVMVHFVSNAPFIVAKDLVREIEISHWGNVQITEHYNLIHAGAQNTGEFSRLDYQARPHQRGASAVNHLVARLPPRAHSVYYRDEIGNVSTSNLWSDSAKTLLEIEPRYPMIGGWKTAFTIGYGLPLHDFLFYSEGKRYLNISFGSPINDLVIENLTVKVVLPEGSKDITLSVPFSCKQWQEAKISHLDLVGRPVAVVEKTNVVPEHNQYFQVYYRFNNLSLFREPLMLISGFLFFFAACIIYTHADLTISKSSPSYLAKLQWDEVQSVVHQVRSIIKECLTIHEKMEVSLRDLSRRGEVQPCKATRKAAESSLKELSKELKPLLGFLQSSNQAAHILPKVEELVMKERELQEKIWLKHSTVVESFERKSSAKDTDSRVAAIQQKITALRHEVDDILEVVDEI